MGMEWDGIVERVRREGVYISKQHLGSKMESEIPNGGYTSP